jgi:hypothetical protein
MRVRRGLERQRIRRVALLDRVDLGDPGCEHAVVDEADAGLRHLPLRLPLGTLGREPAACPSTTDGLSPAPLSFFSAVSVTSL